MNPNKSYAPRHAGYKSPGVEGIVPGPKAPNSGKSAPASGPGTKGQPAPLKNGVPTFGAKSGGKAPSGGSSSMPSKSKGVVPPC